MKVHNPLSPRAESGCSDKLLSVAFFVSSRSSEQQLGRSVPQQKAAMPAAAFSKGFSLNGGCVAK